VVDTAKRVGVTRLVALSALNADDDLSRQSSGVRGDRNKEVEQLAVDSGLEWVSLRPSAFATSVAPHVGRPDPRRRSGARPLRRGVDRAVCGKRHRSGGRPRVAR
jgi:hypothetical protein